ncbi:type II toxin-antitoxin system VapB family antitoxin [Bradyrhizobium genosp. A]|uniref:type II toxin-antitoxin system VapB family antitoxin n=1 Tax=Bradyrhizobium genosp. A TaxID=83626 RepID=UPI003CE86D48
MIATISINDELFAKVRQFVGVAETSAVVEQALRAFVQRPHAVLRAPEGSSLMPVRRHDAVPDIQ